MKTKPINIHFNNLAVSKWFKLGYGIQVFNQHIKQKKGKKMRLLQTGLIFSREINLKILALAG